MPGIRVQLELDDGTFTTRMMHASQSIGQFNRQIEGTVVSLQRVEPAHRSLIGRMRDTIVVVAMVRLAFDNIRTATTGWVGDLLKVNAEFERLTILLRGMSRAADPMKEATQQVADMRNFAMQAPYSVKELMNTFVKLRTTGIDPLAGPMQALVDTVASFGGNGDALKRSTVALQQMSGKGVIQMEELRQQLGEHVPRAVEIMARSIGLSIPQMLKLINTGTLESKSALRSFYGEMERSFGGAALAQMQTFNGLIAQTQTIIQSLALTTGEAGFFDLIKGQIRDINEFLRGNAAKVLATDLASAMSSVTNAIRSTIEWVVEFRNELGSIAKIAAYGLGLHFMMNGLFNITGALQGTVTATRVLRMEMAALNTAWNFTNLGMAIGQLGIAGLGVTALAGAKTKAGIAARFLGLSLSFLSTYVLPIGAVLLAAGYAFGLFSDKIEEAYQAVKKYGAEDEAQLKLAQKAVEAAQLRVEALDRVAEAHRRTRPDGMPSNVLQQAIIEALKERNEREAELEEAAIGLKVKLRERAIAADNRMFDEQALARTRAYDKAETQRAVEHEKALALLNAQNKSTDVLEKKFQDDRRRASLQNYRSQYLELDKHLEEVKQKVAKGTYSADIGEALENNIYKRQNAAVAAAKALSEELKGPKIVTSGKSLEQALEKADTMIKTLNGNIEKNKAALAGANGELAQFIYSLEAGRTGKLNIFGSAELEEKISQLKELMKLSEELEAANRGRQKYDRDVAAFAQKAAERRFAAENKDKSEAEKIELRRRNGFYGGLKSTAQLQASYQQLFSKLDTSAQNAALGMEAVMGDKMQAKGRGMLGVIQQMAGAWNSFRFSADKAKGDLLKNSVLGGANSAGTPGGAMGPFPFVDQVVTPASEAALAKGIKDDAAAAVAESRTKLDEKIDEMRAAIVANNDSLGTNNTHVKALTTAIVKGEYDVDRGGLGRDPNSPSFSKAMAEAKARDASDKAHARAQSDFAKNEAKLTAMAADRVSLAEREADLRRRFRDESNFKTPNSQFRIATKYDKDITSLNEDVAKGIGNKAANERALAELHSLKQRYIDVEAASLIQGEQKKIDAIEQSLMTADQARQFAHDREVQRLDEELAKVSMTSMFRIQAEETVARAKGLLAKKMALDSPVGKMFKDWSDLGNNFQQTSVGWMGSFTDNIAQMVATGKMDFKSLADSIIADMVRVGIRAAIGNFMGPMLGLGGGGSKGGLGGGLGKVGSVAQAHVGGIAGAIRETRMVDLTAFTNAQRFHKGGFPGMKANEVPIIAMKGEEVGWPDQLAKKYGGGGGVAQTNTFNVEVNGSAGTPEQNDDLVEKISKALYDKVNVMATGAIRDQMRPGGLLAQ